MLADIDEFKRINDTHGHDCGDAVLLEVAQRLQTRLRKTDVVSRWGGEEFLILLPSTGGDSIQSVVDELRLAVANEPIVFGQQKMKVTMTFGIAHRSKGDSSDRIVKRADEALYQGKRAGRNCVIVAPQSLAS